MATLYEQILNDLKQAILSKELLPGSQLPTEMQLSEQYQVSRITSKRALTELENLGLIERTRGKGSFVKELVTPTQNKRILFLLPFSNDLSLGNFSEGLLPVLEQEQYDLLMTDFRYLQTHDYKSIQTEFSGLIYYATTEQEHLELLLELSLTGFPVIVLDKEIHDLAFPTVIANNFSGGALATEWLMTQRHRTIGYLAGSSLLPQSTTQRYLGYRQVLSTNKMFYLPANEIARLDTFLDIQQAYGITAWVCENDLVAIDAMRRLKENELTVPEAVSIIGFDDIQAASLVDPALTTISQNFDQIGYVAGSALLEWIQTGQKPVSQKIDVRLIKRDSTKELIYETNN